MINGLSIPACIDVGVVSGANIQNAQSADLLGRAWGLRDKIVLIRFFDGSELNV